MRIARIPADEQFRLIMECRASSLTLEGLMIDLLWDDLEVVKGMKKIIINNIRNIDYLEPANKKSIVK